MGNANRRVEVPVEVDDFPTREIAIECMKTKQFIPKHPRIKLEAKNLITQLMQIKPKYRLGFGREGSQNVMAHSFFYGLNWSRSVLVRKIPPFKPNVKDERDLQHFYDRKEKPEKLTPDTSGYSRRHDGWIEDFDATNPFSYRKRH